MADQHTSDASSEGDAEYPIPDEIATLLTDDELSNLRSRTGWAIGVVKDVTPNGTDTLDPAFIELLNGNGTARELGGVRFLAVSTAGEFREGYEYPSPDSGKFREGYAYPSPDTVEARDLYFVVESYHDPTDPDWGAAVPPL